MIKKIIRVILRIATFIIIFMVLFGVMIQLFDLNIIPNLWDNILCFWLCLLTALKISLIKEDF